MARYACQEQMHDCQCCDARFALREMSQRIATNFDVQHDGYFATSIEYHCPNCDQLLIIDHLNDVITSHVPNH